MRATVAGEGMSRDRDHHLALRHRRLVIRSAELRLTLASQAEVLRAPLAAADTARAGVQWFRRHPYWVMGSGLLLVALRPSRALRWTSRLWWGWRTFKRTQRWLATTPARRL